jgi:hypothetical protein
MQVNATTPPIQPTPHHSCMNSSCSSLVHLHATAIPVEGQWPKRCAERRLRGARPRSVRTRPWTPFTTNTKGRIPRPRSRVAEVVLEPSDHATDALEAPSLRMAARWPYAYEQCLHSVLRRMDYQFIIKPPLVGWPSVVEVPGDPSAGVVIYPPLQLTVAARLPRDILLDNCKVALAASSWRRAQAAMQLCSCAGEPHSLYRSHLLWSRSSYLPLQF